MATREWLVGYRGNRTQQAVADKMGVVRSTLTKIELGMMPSVATAKKIASFYGFNWVIFFDVSCSDSKSKDVV